MSNSSSADSSSELSLNLAPFSALNIQSYGKASNRHSFVSVDARPSRDRHPKGGDRMKFSAASCSNDRHAPSTSPKKQRVRMGKVIIANLSLVKLIGRQKL